MAAPETPEPAPAATPGADDPPARDASPFAHVDTLRPLRIWDGVVGRTVHGERVTLSLIELDPDAVVPEHDHPIEQVGILLDGSFEIRVGGEERGLTIGDTWCIPAGVPHEVRVGPLGAVIVEVFSPPRADWSALASGEPGRGRWP